MALAERRWSFVTSASGVLSAWLDFNRDGDWADAGEQIFTNAPLHSGFNALTFNVPNTATATNLTFARFRFSTASNLTFTGSAPDGEVEDYAVEMLPASQTPGPVGFFFVSQSVKSPFASASRSRSLT